MTWAKYGTEFWDQLADDALSDAAARTHAEGIAWLYGIDRPNLTDLSIPKHLVRRFAGSPEWETGVKELVAAGYWLEAGQNYVVEHHGDVIRGSLAAQRKHREDEKARQRMKRAARKPTVAPNVGTNVSATQTDRHTGTYRGADSEQTCDWCKGSGCPQCE